MGCQQSNLRDHPAPRWWGAQQTSDAVLQCAVPHHILPQLLRPVVAAYWEAHHPTRAQAAATLESLDADAGIEDSDLHDAHTLTNLATVNLSGCHRLTPKSLALLPKLPRLRTVDLTGCAAVSRSALGYVANTTSVSSLWLSHCHCVDSGGLAAVSTMKRSLTALYLNGCHGVTADGLCSIGQLSNLETLVITSAPMVDDDGVAHLTNLTRLTNLDVSGTSITNSGFCHLGQITSLEVLGLGQLHLDADSLFSIAALPQLHTLRHQGSDFSSADVLEPFTIQCRKAAADPPLRSLDLSHSHRVVPSCLALIGSLVNLEWLSLSALPAGAVTPDVMRAVATLPALATLKLVRLRAYCGISCFSGCPTLTDLDVSELPDPAFLREVGCISSLRTLNASGGNVDAAGLECLSTGLHGLTELNLASSRGLCETGFGHVAALKGLTMLNLSQVVMYLSSSALLPVAPVANLNRLTTLSLFASKSGFEALGGLRELTSVDLVGNGVGSDSCLAALAGLSRTLTSVKLSSCIIPPGGFRHLGCLVNLTTLHLCTCGGVASSDLAYLTGLGKLRSLSLSGCRTVDGAALRHITRLRALRDLDCSGTAVSRNNVLVLLELPFLRRVVTGKFENFSAIDLDRLRSPPFFS